MQNFPWLFAALMASMSLSSLVVIKLCSRPRSLSEVSSGKYRSLDALRGVLGASVFVHHASFARIYFAEGVWKGPDSSLYSFAGGGAVAAFFMITGLLFWGQAIDGKVRPLALLRSRLRRIMPLYLFSCALIFWICFSRTDYRLRVGLADVSMALLRWLAGGALGDPSINGIDMPTVNAGVTWSLRYEWAFYAALPLFAVLSPVRRFPWLIAVYVIAVLAAELSNAMRQSDQLLRCLPFFVGMSAAYVVRLRTSSGWPHSRSAAFVVLLSVIFLGCFYDEIGATASTILLMPAFVLVAMGNNVFGLLEMAWLRWLGHISFSVYLLHGIVLMFVLGAVDRHVRISGLSDAAYVCLCAAIGVLVVGLSSTTHLFIERKFQFSRAARLKQRAVVQV